VGERLVQELDKSGPQTALLYGGETTVTIKGSGRGGRNQELVLSALRQIKNGELILSLASDGRDNSDFAGALCDIMTRERAEKLHLDWNKYLAANDSYNFFAAAGDYLLTGPTGANVSDLITALRA
jgi:hydroxypyruvate reductase/glycerate 2-kinase